MTTDNRESLATVAPDDETALATDSPDRLVFDADGSQFLPSGEPCSLCGIRMSTVGMWSPSNPRAFIRVRRKVPGGTDPVAMLCPTCIARALLQVGRHDLLKYVNPTVLAAIDRMIDKQRGAASRNRRLPKGTR